MPSRNKTCEKNGFGHREKAISEGPATWSTGSWGAGRASPHGAGLPAEERRALPGSSECLGQAVRGGFFLDHQRMGPMKNLPHTPWWARLSPDSEVPSQPNLVQPEHLAGLPRSRRPLAYILPLTETSFPTVLSLDRNLAPCTNSVAQTHSNLPIATPLRPTPCSPSLPPLLLALCSPSVCP